MKMFCYRILLCFVSVTKESILREDYKTFGTRSKSPFKAGPSMTESNNPINVLSGVYKKESSVNLYFTQFHVLQLLIKQRLAECTGVKPTANKQRQIT